MPTLAAKTLALNTRRAATDWQAVYGHPVVLAETFVDPARFAGTAYRAAGWQYLGPTPPLCVPRPPESPLGPPVARGQSSGPDGAVSPPTLQGGALTLVDFNALNWVGPGGLHDRLHALIDPRHRRGIRHSVTQVLVLALAAVVAGQRSFIAIGDWIHDLNPEQRALFGCPRWGQTFKVPSEPTVRRVLQKMDADALDMVLPTGPGGFAPVELTPSSGLMRINPVIDRVSPRLREDSISPLETCLAYPPVNS